MDELILVSALVLRVGTDKLTNKPGCRRKVALHFDGTELKINFEGCAKYNQENLKWKYKQVKLIPSRRCYTHREGDASGVKVLTPISGVGYDTIQADGLSLMYELPPTNQRAQIRRILKPSKLHQRRQSTTHSISPSLTQPPSDTPTITNPLEKHDEESDAGKEIVEHRILGYVLKTPERDSIELPFRDSKPDGAYIDAAQGVPSLFLLAVEAVAQEIRALQRAKTEQVKATEKQNKDDEDRQLQSLRKQESRLQEWGQDQENKVREQELQLLAKFQVQESQLRARRRQQEYELQDEGRRRRKMEILLRERRREEANRLREEEQQIFAKFQAQESRLQARIRVREVQLQEQRRQVLEKFQKQEQQLQEQRHHQLTRLQPKYQALISDVERKYNSAIEERHAFISELPQANLAMCTRCPSVRSADKIVKCSTCGRLLCPECSDDGRCICPCCSPLRSPSLPECRCLFSCLQW